MEGDFLFHVIINFRVETEKTIQEVMKEWIEKNKEFLKMNEINNPVVFEDLSLMYPIDMNGKDKIKDIDYYPAISEKFVRERRLREKCAICEMEYECPEDSDCMKCEIGRIIPDPIEKFDVVCVCKKCGESKDWWKGK